MIDPNLLRQLGWSEDLISEVNRVAETIDSYNENYHQVNEPLLHKRSVSGTALHIGQQEIKTSFGFFFKSDKK